MGGVGAVNVWAGCWLGHHYQSLTGATTEAQLTTVCKGYKNKFRKV